VALSKSGHDPEEDALVVMRLYQQVSTSTRRPLVYPSKLWRSMQAYHTVHLDNHRTPLCLQLSA
jgi:hypothetical protein